MSKNRQATKHNMFIAGPRVPSRPDVRRLERPEPTKDRKLGLGSPINLQRVRGAEGLGAGLAGVCDAIKDSLNCPVWNTPVIEQVRWGMNGPQSDLSVQKNFGAKIDLFGSGESADDIDYVETTMAQPGETQTHMICTAVLFHLEPAPFNFTAKGNAWTHPTTGAAQPPSPDVFTQNDRFNGALGAAISGSSPTQVFVPSLLDYGKWAGLASWHLARGYNLRWKIGQHTNIFDMVLRHVAYVPVNAQQGSASSSEIDLALIVRDMNDRYEGLGSALDFLKINRTRIGSVGTGGSNFGIFRPSRDEELVGLTFGGVDICSPLRQNSEAYKLTIPYWIKAGVPIGLVAQENDSDQGDAMREALSITCGFGGAIPPLVTDALNINAVVDGTGSGNVALERTLDTTPSNVPQQVDAERALFKAGPFKITLGVKGFEVDEDWYQTCQNNPDLRDYIMNETKTRWS